MDSAAQAGTDGRTASSDRTRAALLRAARDEFAERGYAGARVASIAARAGVNKQLITYHFGGKQGLYDQLLQTWLEREKALRADAPSLGELMVRYLQAGLAEPQFRRMALRQALDHITRQQSDAEADQAGGPTDTGSVGAGSIDVGISRGSIDTGSVDRGSVDTGSIDTDAADIADLRARQQAGEIAPDLDPELLLIAITGMVSAPYFSAAGKPVDTDRYADLLRRIATHLSGH